MPIDSICSSTNQHKFVNYLRVKRLCAFAKETIISSKDTDSYKQSKLITIYYENVIDSKEAKTFTIRINKIIINYVNIIKCITRINEYFCIS